MVVREEALTSPTDKARVDSVKRIIYGVKIIGKNSKNRRRYPDEVVKRRLSLYESAQVYSDHDYSKSKKPRPMRDLAGVLRGCRWEDGAPRADLHCIDSPAGNMILSAAIQCPDKFGLSPMHRIEAKMGVDGIEEVTDIIDVVSVDAVTRPATTRGLYESEMEAPAVDAGPRSVEDIIGELITELMHGGKDDLVKEVMKLKAKITGADEEEPNGEPGDAPGESQEADMTDQTAADVVQLLGVYQYQASEAQFDELVSLDTRSRIAKIREFKAALRTRPAAAKLPVKSSAQKAVVSEAEEQQPKDSPPMLTAGADRAKVLAYYSR